MLPYIAYMDPMGYIYILYIINISCSTTFPMVSKQVQASHHASAALRPLGSPQCVKRSGAVGRTGDFHPPEFMDVFTYVYILCEMYDTMIGNN